MAWLADVMNAANSAIDQAQDFANAAVDTGQQIMQSAVDTTQASMNQVFDTMQDGYVQTAGIYDRLLGTNVFTSMVNEVNAVLDREQSLTNRVQDLTEQVAQGSVDLVQRSANFTVDAEQFAWATLAGKLDAATNVPAMPTIV